MERKLVLEIAALIILVGFVCFAGGFYAGSREITTYATTKEISVNVKVITKESGTIEKTVSIRDGMTPFDALLKVTDMQTKYWESYGTSTVSSVAGDNLGPNEGYTYTVNGETPAAGMSDYQLHDGDNLVVSYTTW
jgi:uncharacterized membrane protein